MTTIDIDGYNLTIDQLTRLARDPDVTARLAPDASDRMQASADLRAELVASNTAIYGVTTGFGDSARTLISADQADALQGDLIRFLLSGQGETTPHSVTRAMIAVRANCLARGVSGARPLIAEMLVDLLNHNITPLVPQRGSVGASGDLVPSAYLAETLMGEGSVHFNGTTTTAAAALQAIGLRPVKLQAKEALALVNGTSFMTAYAALSLHAARELALGADACTALTSQVLGGFAAHFASFLTDHKPHPGQIASAALVSTLLEGSTMSGQAEQHVPGDTKEVRKLNRQVQDRYSVRCAPHVTGVLRDTVEWASRWVETEINSANDNPLFDVDSGEVFSGGNFYGGHVVAAMDALKVAVSSVADLMDRQLALIVDDKFNNGLPSNLVDEHRDETGMSHGYKGMQIACSALAAEALKNSTPATVFSRSTESHNQDKVSMGSIGARDAWNVVDLTRNAMAIHLHALCQGAELRGSERLSPATKVLWDSVRDKVDFLVADRPLDREIALLADLIDDGGFSQTIGKYDGSSKDD
ncbi:HAL/PAL/TAL family ammonia-lyase [Haloglycomyces albus]|uniref:HAL/PAL/TAL family ammonia-lyase n=1 Tax=Haloglycomyces albus TaxID=526067 RepID=UPI00046D7018|nr:aromatic amino acid ammonia-lyase [Haloglycomyces albus]